MTLMVCLVSMTLAQPVVRPLGAGDRSSGLRVVATSDTSVWFTAASDDTPQAGGTRVYRLVRDGGQVESIVGNTEWKGQRQQGLLAWGRGAALMTGSGELGPNGLLTRFGEPSLLFAANDAVLLVVGGRVLFSSSPGVLRELDAPRPFGLIASTADGRIGWATTGTQTVLLSPDGGVELRARVFGGSAGSTFLFLEDTTLTNEAGQVLATVLESSRQPGSTASSATWFPGAAGRPIVTDGTPAGTRTLAGRNEQLRQVTEAFATFEVDGGLIVEAFSGGRAAAAPFSGVALKDRLLRGNLELFADGGLLRRDDVHDCDWRPVVGRWSELWCTFDGGLWGRASPDSPQREHFAGPVGVAAGHLAAPQIEGVPLLIEQPRLLWTDGVEVFPLKGVGAPAGQFEDGVVFADDGISVVDPRTGGTRAFGFGVAWRPVTSLRVLFAERSTGLRTCVVRRVDPDAGTLEQVRFDGVDECILRLVDHPDGLEAFTSKGVFVWDETIGQFASVRPPRVTPEQTLTFEAVPPEGVLTPHGRLLSEWGLLSLSLPRAGTVSGLTAAGVTWSRQGLWLVNWNSLQFTEGGPLQDVVPADGFQWRPPGMAVGRALLFELDTELVAVRPDGSLLRRSFVRREPALAMQGARWYALDDGAHGVEPWVFDGTAFRLVDLVPGPDSSFPRFVGAAHGRVVVEANRPDRSIGLTSIEFQPRVGLSPFAPASGEQPRPCGCEGSPTLGPTMALLLVLAQKRRRKARLRGTATEARPRCCQ
jgi:ELWxxDGT repeat protein